MKQKIGDIKASIKYYSRLNIEVTSIELEDDIDTFFSTSNIDVHYTINEHTDDIAYMNELLYLAKRLELIKNFIYST